MVHNGIEHGMMTAFSEAWEVMTTGLGMSYNEDVANSAGTGTWAAEEGIRLHVVHPTIALSRIFRAALTEAAKRESIKKALGGGVQPGKINGIVGRKKLVHEEVQQAMYASLLMSFIQGLHMLSRASQENGWNINFLDVLQVWRAGCIIQSDGIVDFLEGVHKTSKLDHDNLPASTSVVEELQRDYPGLEAAVWRAIEADLHVPALSASLEYFKYSSSTSLPTQFAELDYFGAHMFNLRFEGPGKPQTGSYHFEWKEAKGSQET
ncbi:hypothetical protein QC761_0101880 [Podospora bellae-mahoneyi]|uniref:phosphogluconate dehydrogenase (NADP(+)-dependent, decarboxylating) n=1 Tax=Podospora bellae-mahoneyi TaxID=2093777 RepID=A0ABR0F787_9PEZI|nr:hypothetical protein QC761_0101880 [Podospora bellae-mahoneyi]